MRTGKREVSTEQIDYRLWIKSNEENIRQIMPLNYRPKVSVVIEACGVEEAYVNECVASVKNQTYPEVEICVAKDGDTLEHAAVTGDYIGYVHGLDLLSPNAVYEMVKVLNDHPEYDMVYSDEDVFDNDISYRFQPFFKPDWSPDLLWSFDYCARFAVFKTNIADKIHGPKENLNEQKYYDFIFRFLEQAAALKANVGVATNEMVGHVDKVLYHVRKGTKPTISKEILKSVKEEALKRRGIKAHLEWKEKLQNYHVLYDLTDNPLVSIIVLSKDNKDVLNNCVTSILEHTEYPNYEIIVVDNGSKNPDEIEAMLSGRATYIYKPMDFNFSAQNNIGVKVSKGEYVLLLNDDVEVVETEWLTRMLGQAMQPHTGAVGVKLYYPDSTLLQHCGVINMGEGPNHAFAKESDESSLYFGRNRYTYNFLAVTAACILCSKEKYLEVGGLDENLPVAFNDVDFCMRLYEAGYYNVLRNDVMAYHHESLSRGSDFLDVKKMERLRRELKQLYTKHPAFEGWDPFYSRNLTVHSLDFALEGNYEKVTEKNWRLLTGLKGESRDYKLSVDCIEKAPVIRLLGHCATNGSRLDKSAKWTLLLKLRDDYILEFDTYALPKAKSDDKTNRNDFKFIALMDSGLFKGESREYTFGIKYEYEGKVSYEWSDIVFETVSDDTCFGTAFISDIGEADEEGIILSMDGAVKGDSTMHVKGWGFDCHDFLHNDYKLKYLAFETKDGYRKATTHTKYRADLMTTYPEYANMYYSGFEMLVAYNQIKDDNGKNWYFVIEDMRDHRRIHKEIDF